MAESNPASDPGMVDEAKLEDKGSGLVAASSRQFQKDGPWGYYCAGEAAAKYNAASPEDTQDGSIAYARFPDPREARYPAGLLPGG
jgi:hypothetical protein